MIKFTTQELEMENNLRVLYIASFNKEYGLNDILKTKQKGRNKDNEIKELKKENHNLKQMAYYFKDLFNRLVNFIKHKMFGKDTEREDYWEFSKDLYEHGIFSDETIKSIQDDYKWSKDNDKDKDYDKDDFEI